MIYTKLIILIVPFSHIIMLLLACRYTSFPCQILLCRDKFILSISPHLSLYTSILMYHNALKEEYSMMPNCSSVVASSIFVTTFSDATTSVTKSSVYHRLCLVIDLRSCPLKYLITFQAGFDLNTDAKMWIKWYGISKLYVQTGIRVKNSSHWFLSAI